MRDRVKAMTPEFVRAIYRRSRRAARSVRRALRGVTTCRVRGATVRIAVGSEQEQWRVETYASKEPETLDWLDAHLRDGDTLFDVGANIGLYALYAAITRPGSLVYAFEPAFMNYARLCENIALNDLTNVIPCNFPLAGRDAFGLFHVGDLERGSALHAFGRPSEYRAASAPAPVIQGSLAVTLDTLVTRHGVPTPALVKLDVDGLEEEILAGAAVVLRSATLRSLLVELSGKDDAALAVAADRIVALGYRIARTSHWTSELSDIRSRNYVFVRGGSA